MNPKQEVTVLQPFSQPSDEGMIDCIWVYIIPNRFELADHRIDNINDWVHEFTEEALIKVIPQSFQKIRRMNTAHALASLVTLSGWEDEDGSRQLAPDEFWEKFCEYIRR